DRLRRWRRACDRLSGSTRTQKQQRDKNGNDTIGGHEGRVNAIGVGSLTAMVKPAASGAGGQARTPGITSPDTAPDPAEICAGVSVKLNARQTPATPANAPQTPDSSSACARRLTPNAAAMGASSASARSARPRLV